MAPVNAPANAVSSPAVIPVRKPKLDFGREIDRFYFGGNPVKTHLFNALNLLFPEGERFFVKSVHDHAKEISDPHLLAEIRGFAGQEGQHANQHERFFVVLERQGYDVPRIMKPFLFVAKHARHLPRALRLAITAGAEHYTATMAALLLTQNLADECDPTLRDLMKWHALEEVEHKHVAYDVLISRYRYNYPLRMLGYLLATLAIVGFTAFGLRSLLTQDGRARRLTRAQFEAARAEMHSGQQLRFRRALWPELLRYLKPGFHPNQKDDSPLLARFGPEVASTLIPQA